jgi:penicillin-binding protein-related factor A (putative recombinase)
MVKEKKIESDILRWLNLQPSTFAFKVNTIGIFDPIKKIYRKNRNPYLIKGTHDIIGVCQGRFFSIEVKSDKGKLTEDQYLFGLKVRQSQGECLMVAQSLDQVIYWMKTFLLPHPAPLLASKRDISSQIP